MEKASRDLGFLRNRAWRIVARAPGYLPETDCEYLLELVVAQLILLRFRYLRAKRLGCAKEFAEHMLGQMCRYTTLVVKLLAETPEGQYLDRSYCASCPQLSRERLWDPGWKD